MLEKDCKFFDEEEQSCKALKKLYCDKEREKCRFYKNNVEMLQEGDKNEG